MGDKILLIESLTIDCSNDVIERKDLYENLENKTISIKHKVIKEGKEIEESIDMDVLGIYRVPVSRPDIMNKNNRKYSLERTWKPVLEQKMGEGSLGLLNHPASGSPPDIGKVCCVWRDHKAEIDENGKPVIRADMYLLNDKKGNGDLVESIIRAGGKVDLSTRGYGEIDDLGEVFNYDYKATDIVYEGSYGVKAEKSHRSSEATKLESKTKENKVITEEGKNASQIDTQLTNNKDLQGSVKGDSDMGNKVLIRKTIKETFEQPNKFQAFNELKVMLEDLKGSEDYKDLATDVQNKISQLEPALEEGFNKAMTEAHDDTPGDKEYSGDYKDSGTASGPGTKNKMIYPDPEQKIKDSDEALPDDVHDHDEDPDKDDTTDAERADGKYRAYQPADSRGAMKSEVMSGEVSHESLFLQDGTPVYEDEESYLYILGEDDLAYPLEDGIEVFEDSDESIPDDIHSHEVGADDQEDSDEEDRSAYTDVKPTDGYHDVPGKNKEGGKKVQQSSMEAMKYGPDYRKKMMKKKMKKMDYESAPMEAMHYGPGYKKKMMKYGPDYKKKMKKMDYESSPPVNLYKLNKEQLIDCVQSMDEAVKGLQGDLVHEQACYETISDMFLRMETWALMCENVVGHEKGEKDDARIEAVEAVEYAKGIQVRNEELESSFGGKDEYIEKLENENYQHSEDTKEFNEVAPYVSTIIQANPFLNAWRNELNKCTTITEVREAADRYNQMKGKIRLDKPMITEESQMITENNKNPRLQKLHNKGMI